MKEVKLRNTTLKKFKILLPISFFIIFIDNYFLNRTLKLI